MRMRIVDFQPSEQAVKLLFTDMNSACFCGLWPTKVAFFQSTVIKPKAIEIPKQNFDFISIAMTKNGTHHLKGFSGNRSNRDPQFDSCRTG